MKASSDTLYIDYNGEAKTPVTLEGVCDEIFGYDDHLPGTSDKFPDWIKITNGGDGKFEISPDAKKFKELYGYNNAPGDTLDTIAAEIRACRACPLCQRRLNPVPGEGNSDHPDIMFIGEGPGADEDAQGLAFVGRAGQLLTKMIAAMGYTREQVFIGNIVKCRPPGNRTPTPQEMAWCMPYLKRQIAVIRPKLIVCLGSTAVRGLIGEQTGITRIRGTWREFEGIPVMLTFHPAYLLRNPAEKGKVWTDLKAVLARLKQS